MRNLGVVFAVVVTAAALLSSCQSMTGETAGENLDDAAITTAVKAKLAAEKPATLTQVGVETNLRIVHLTGVVPSDVLRDRAGELTRAVKGVRDVRNDIQVRPAS
jgi:hyperosmotically inducible periplasmic protein